MWKNSVLIAAIAVIRATYTGLASAPSGTKLGSCIVKPGEWGSLICAASLGIPKPCLLIYRRRYE
jgi:hypothetical protein